MLPGSIKSTLEAERQEYSGDQKVDYAANYCASASPSGPIRRARSMGIPEFFVFVGRGVLLR